MDTLRHGGDLRRLAHEAGVPPGRLIDFSANINPLGPPEWLRSCVSAALDQIVHYPDPVCRELAAAIARFHGVEASRVVCGNGSSELLPHLLRVAGARGAVLVTPGYAEYERSARAAGLDVTTFPLQPDDGFTLDVEALEAGLLTDDLVIIGQPNNPTGQVTDPAEIRRMARRRPGCTFVIDEAFADFAPQVESLAYDPPDNVVVLRSMTKFFAIPGLRLGYALARPGLAHSLREALPPWTVNTLAQAVGTRALAADMDGYRADTLRLVDQQRDALAGQLQELGGLTVFPSAANFLLLRIDRPGLDAPGLAERLLKRRIAVRVCDNYRGLDRHYLRVAVRTEEENGRLLRALHTAMGEGRRKPVRPPVRRPALMFQGTGSGAGKSVLTAALCRILLQDGHDVAPFKAQNMSLNSFVTRDGGEMGRAQVVQAQACRLDPDVRMNPVLLKPSSDTGSQVIVMGQPVGTMKVDRYIEYKEKARRAALDAYDDLAASHQVMVLEGAGSPAEVNLKRHDMVNMQMARHADAKVLLVGDIDRGGVFASFIGTMELLTQPERRLLRGFVVNRFRGDASLLQEAHDYMELATHRPVLGVVPYLRHLGLPEEDSVALRRGELDAPVTAEQVVDIAVVDLPHLSNFTDFDPLGIEPDVRVRYVRNAKGLGTPDALILPGSKNVVADMDFLRDRGWPEAIARVAASGTEVVGICAGLQLLGRRIADPHGIESEGAEIDGLGLLPIVTELAPAKTLRRQRATHLPSGLPLQGYEIHHGLSTPGGSTAVVHDQDGQPVGFGLGEDPLWGTYLHGLFDADPFRRWFVDRQRVRKGLPPLGEVQAVYDIEPALDRLADVVRASLDMDAIYRMLRL